MKKWIVGLILKSLLNRRTGEFWMLTINAITQLLLRVLPAEIGAERVAEIARTVADLLLTLIPVGLGRIVSKTAKGVEGFDVTPRPGG